jgi:hypothetical protein
LRAKVKFTVPQPEGAENLNEIPKPFQGEYLSLSDSSALVIDSHSISKQWSSVEVLHRDSLAHELKVPIRGDTVVHLTDRIPFDSAPTHFVLNIQITNDSASIKVNAREMLFSLSDSQLVRKYKGCCFLNYRTPDGLWLVKTLRLKNGFLDFSDLIDSKEIDVIDDFTRVTLVNDTLPVKDQEYHLTPTRRELRRIIRAKPMEKMYKKL